MIGYAWTRLVLKGEFTFVVTSWSKVGSMDKWPMVSVTARCASIRQISMSGLAKTDPVKEFRDQWLSLQSCYQQTPQVQTLSKQLRKPVYKVDSSNHSQWKCNLIPVISQAMTRLCCCTSHEGMISDSACIHNLHWDPDAEDNQGPQLVQTTEWCWFLAAFSRVLDSGVPCKCQNRSLAVWLNCNNGSELQTLFSTPGPLGECSIPFKTDTLRQAAFRITIKDHLLWHSTTSLSDLVLMQISYRILGSAFLIKPPLSHTIGQSRVGSSCSLSPRTLPGSSSSRLACTWSPWILTVITMPSADTVIVRTFTSPPKIPIKILRPTAILSS